MADIFISYTSKDRDRVIPILKALEKQGWFLFGLGFLIDSLRAFGESATHGL